MIRLDDARIRAAEAIFREIVDFSVERRHAAVEERCGSDVALRTLVERLLVADSSEASGHTTVFSSRFRSRQPTNNPGRVGQFEIIREIGRGGVGVVYEAQQQNPQRRVALKLLRYASPSAELFRRFQLEAEALGRLNHVGIAQIYDAGVVDIKMPSGGIEATPFVAMELVEGTPLCEYADKNQLSITSRLNLMAAVCDAVQHAHQKGVIHRDLKPGNILVRTRDSEKCDGDLSEQSSYHSKSDPSQSAQPKILDFGVARLLGTDANAATFQTSAGQILGTLAYMSPEQLTGDSCAVDTRSDVYSLGIIAYELLVGFLPVNISRVPLPQAIRTLAEATPPRPVTLCSALRGDVDAMLTRAMEKTPDRRYPSAAEFAADIRRHLRGEPISARPATAWYTVQKAVLRHRTEAILAGLLLLLLCGATVALLLLHWRAVQGWDAAAKQKQEAITARDAEHTARDTAEAISGFLNEMLAAARPDERGKDASLIEVLNSASQRLDAGSFKDQPAAAAAVYTTIGTTWQSLGDFKQAETHFQRALEIRREFRGGPHAEIATTLNHIGEARYLNGDSDGAERFFQESLAMRRQLYGEVHADVAECYNNLALVAQERKRFDQAEQSLREAMRIWQATLNPDDENIELSLNNLGVLLVERGRQAEAVDLLRRVYELRLKRYGRDDHTLVNLSRNNLARCWDGLGLYRDAEPLHRINLAIQREKLPTGHSITRHTIINLVECLRGQQRFSDAEALLREEIGESTLAEADDSPSLAALFGSLGLVLTDRDDAADAEPILRWQVNYEIREHGEFHNSVAAAMNNLGDALLDKGDLEGATSWIERALFVNEQVHGTRENASNAMYRHHLANVLARRNECELAIENFREALEIRTATLGAKHPLTQSTARALHILESQRSGENQDF